MNVAATALRTPQETGVGTGDEAVRIVRQTLKGPVIEILRKLVPELGKTSLEEGYDHTLGHLPILEKCFLAFRQNRHEFNRVLTDKAGRVVTNDTGLLACGHNIEVVVSMIVRTAAKRYFRHHVGLHQTPKWTSQKSGGLLGKVRSAIALPDKSKLLAEELYDCIKSYLLYEWQVPLVPTYAKLSPEQVSTLGSQLLKCMDETALAKAAGLSLPAKTPKNRAVTLVKPTSVQQTLSAPRRMPASRPFSPPAQPPQPIAKAEPAIRPAPAPVQPILGRNMGLAAAQPPGQPTSNPGGKKLSGASFASVLALPHVQAAIDPILHGDNSIRIIDLVNARAWAVLILTLGLRRKDQLAVLLLNAFASLGPQEFNRIFGSQANPEHLDQLIADFSPSDVNPESPLSDIIAFATTTFAPQRTASLR